MGEEVRISRLGLKPAPRSEKAYIGSTEKSTDIRNIASSWLRPGARPPPAYAISAQNSLPLAHSPMYFFYRNYWFQRKLQWIRKCCALIGHHSPSPAWSPAQNRKSKIFNGQKMLRSDWSICTYVCMYVCMYLCM